MRRDTQALRQLGEKERKIESTLQTNIPDTIGLAAGELPARYQRANTQLSTVQTETQAESTRIQGEISRFYERTQKPTYGEVTKEMAEAQPADELDRVRSLIQDNIGMEAMHNLALWAGRFEAWAAEKLKRLVPLNRWQEPADIAAMAVFLASSKAKNVTGQAVNVDGGCVMHS